ncbi:IclR family transcriptional regulator [Nocardia wallacei]|uniref:IclR family transcriptional regulator n=1 Tax=Nocardia wallacei TaxID=480035 RepID=UPI0024565C75|nr:helix-turn-helix domain-containing protein [Nocardia wallacei]
MPRTEPTDGAQTLERGLAVLVELSRHPDGLTIAQVATACGLHRSITTRLLVSLQRTGFARRDQSGAYRVGPAVAELLGRARPRLREVAGPVLERLARTVDATASLVEVIDGFAVTTLVAEPPTDGPRFSYRLGNRDPLDRGAGGVAALAPPPPPPPAPPGPPPAPPVGPPGAPPGPRRAGRGARNRCAATTPAVGW